MENPFVYGEVVPTGAFIDRVVELGRLVGDLSAGQKVFLISPRRYGKSSLIRQALAAVSRRVAQDVFALPGRLAETRRRKVVVALDEFQAIGEFNGGSVESALRAAVQHQREVGYVFAGSEPSLMERMLSPKRPFYKAGPVMRLEKIPAGEFASFIDARFKQSGMRPEDGLGDAIVDLAGNMPYDVQRLAHETWDEVRGGARRRATLDDLHQALKRLLAEHQMMFEAMWQRLTLAQRS